MKTLLKTLIRTAILLTSINMYSQICMNCEKEVIKQFLTENKNNISVRVYKDSIWCYTQSDDIVVYTYYLFKNDTCYKQVNTHNITDFEVVYNSINDTYCNESFKHLWLFYSYINNKTEVIYINLREQKFDVIFECYKNNNQILNIIKRE